jgi:hypothetical protein
LEILKENRQMFGNKHAQGCAEVNWKYILVRFSFVIVSIDRVCTYCLQ